MKAFTTLATILGAASANPSNQMGHMVGNSLMGAHGHQSMDHQDNKMTSSMTMVNRMHQSQLPEHMSSTRGRQMQSHHNTYQMPQLMTMEQMVKGMKDMHSSQMSHTGTSPMADRHMSQKFMPSKKHMSPKYMNKKMEHHQNNMSMQQQQQAQPEQMDRDQYYNRDNMGNYRYGYTSDNSERFEEGNAETGVRGHYTYIDGNGLSKRVDYIADKDGFRILNEVENESRRFKREAEADVNPDLIRTSMTSRLDSSSLRDDSLDMRRMSNNMMGRDMSPMNMMRNNQMSSNMYRSSDLMNRNMMDQHMSVNDMQRNRLGQDMSSSKMLSRQNMNNDNTMMNQYSNMMGQDMSTSLMGQDMSPNMMRQNMGRQMMSSSMMMDKNTMGQNMMENDMGRNMYNNNAMGHNMGANNMRMTSNMMGRDMTSNMMGHEMTSNMMGRDMTSNMMGQGMTSNLMGRDMTSGMDLNRMLAYSKNAANNDEGLLHEKNVLSQRMEVERIPEESSLYLNRFF